MPFGPVHRQGHQLAACSCSSLVSTRLTLGKYSCDQTLPPTGAGIKPLCLKRSLPALAHLFPGKVKINPGPSELKVVISALQARARQVSGAGQVEQGKRWGKKCKGGFSVCICSTETPAEGGGESGQQADPVCLHDSRIGSWISIQERVCGVQVGVCDSLILMSTVKVSTGLPGTETDPGHPPASAATGTGQSQGEGGPCSTLAHDALGTIP